MTKLHYIIISLLVVLITTSSSLFVINQREMAVIFQFGEAVRIIKTPGLHLKLPFIQTVYFLDKRILNVTVAEKEVTASDSKRIIMDAFAKFRIIEPVTFYKTVQNYNGANLRINKILESSMRQVIGKVELKTLLTNERSNIMFKIRDLIDIEAKAFGIDIIDVRILKTDLPTENSAAIYRRMQTEREKQAKQIRAEGREEADKIKSNADKQKKIILAEAYMNAQKIKGAGDKEAAKLYNEAYSKDIQFYEFYRSLITYKKSLSSENTSFVLSPNSDFFKYLKLTDEKTKSKPL